MVLNTELICIAQDLSVIYMKPTAEACFQKAAFISVDSRARHVSSSESTRSCFGVIVTIAIYRFILIGVVTPY